MIVPMRWTPEQVASATGGKLHAPSGSGGDASLSGVSIDTRRLAAGALFVAIRAERDGHDFVDAAVEGGAGALLVASGWALAADLATGVPSIVVEDTRAGLLALGRAARQRLDGAVVGITGSVGKTSTKDLIAAAVSAGRSTWASERSFNNELGVPLTLANAPSDTEVAVIEMGARDIGHIGRLCEVARPTIGVVTAVAAAHTEVFGDLDTVAAAKSELVLALPPDGAAVLNADDPRVLAMASATTANAIRYSTNPAGRTSADVVAEEISLDRELRSRFTVHSPWGSAAVRLSARGAHQVGNALAALAVAGLVGVPLEAAADALASAQLSPWRMELGRSPAGATVLNDAYNANPASMGAALEALASLPADRRIAVLGEMAELGDRRDEEHRAVVALAGQLAIDVLVVGTNAYGIPPVEGIDEAVDALGPIGSGDAVLVKASRVAGLERLAARLMRD
jgi:UDP-N-acetylmuramoyl-tripeptide--D-alanyl-D-alanine ligase